MGLFDSGNGNTLEDVLGQRADTQRMTIQDQFAKKRRQTVAQQAHAGRLGSGSSNYNIGDVNAGEADALAGVDSDLAGTLGQIPTDSYLGDQQFNRDLELSKMIAKMNKPSTLQEVLGGIGTAAQVGGTVAAFL